MKKSLIFTIALICLFTLPVYGSEITVKAVKGEAVFLAPGQEQELPVKAGSVIPEGSTVKTPAGSYVDLVTSQGEFRIKENSSVTLNEGFSQAPLGEGVAPLPQAEILSGSMILKLKELPPNKGFKIKGPTGVAAIRGTAFLIGAENTKTTVSVFENSVELISLDDPLHSVLVNALETTTISPWESTSLHARGTGVLSEAILGKEKIQKMKSVDIKASVAIPFTEQGPIARQKAITAARLNVSSQMAQSIIGIPVDKEKNVGDLVRQDPVLLEEIFNVIETKSAEDLISEGAVGKITLTVPLSVLEDALGISMNRLKNSHEEITFEEYADKFGALARVTTTRAAQLDAYRKLAELIYGTVLSSDTTVKDFVASNDLIRTSIEGLVKGAKKSAVFYYSSGAISVQLNILGPLVKAALLPYIGDLARNYLGAPGPVDIGAYLGYQEFSR